MAADGGSSAAGMVDAQFTVVRVLKPFPNFEQVYQGKQALTPIAFPGDRDPRAVGPQPGYDPNLMRGIPVPFGSRVVLWFPMCFAPSDGPDVEPLTPFGFYSYKLIWRFQNLSSYNKPAAKQRRAPYHFAKESPGAPDTSLGPTLPRVPLPASWHVIAEQGTAPATGPGDLAVRIETITPRLDTLTEFVQPLLADGSAGVIEQGILDPALAGGGQMPIFVPFWTDAEGDELIILATREGATAEVDDVWDFASGAPPPTQGDLAFSNVYGTGNGLHPIYRDIGIYLQTGTNP